MKALPVSIFLAVGSMLSLVGPLRGADNPPPPVFRIQSPPAPVPVADDNPAPPPSAPAQRSAAELEKLAAPIALYPDPLIAIILPAAVYPVEIVQAARFVKDTNNISKLKNQPWDANVRAVAEIPAVIQKMNDDLAWTVGLGQAFVTQPSELMEAIQQLRKNAQAAGTLKTTAQQVVVVTNAVVERTYEQQIVYVTNTVVEIQPANPEVIYVPQYNPAVVYAPSPVYVDPVVPFVTFGVGFAVGAIFANNCDWHYGGVYVGGGGYVVWGGGGGHYPYYPPPYGYRPPPYHPPPGYRPPPPGYRPPGYPPPGTRPPAVPPPGTRPPGTRPPGVPPGGTPPPVVRPPGGSPPPRPTTRPVTPPGGAPRPATGQRWQPDSSRIIQSGAMAPPANLQTRDARGWGSSTAPFAPRPTTGARPGISSPSVRPPSARPSMPPTASPNRSFSVPPPRPSSGGSAFGGAGGASNTRQFSNRGAASRGGGSHGGGGRGR